MIIDKKGKLFGKINIVDIGLIILVVLVIAATYTRFYGNGKASNKISADTKISYTIEIRALKSIYIDEISTGDLITTEDATKQCGKVTSIKTEPYKDFLTDSNGNYKESVVPDQLKVTLTVEAEGVDSGDGYYVNGSPLKVTNTLTIFKTKYIQFGGYVTSINKV